MTTTLQFSVYDMCHCYNNLNSTHTLNMIVYFFPFGLQFELLQQTQMRWPSWFQDLESYQPMGGGLSLVQLMLICTYQIDQTISSNHMQYNAWGIRDIDGYGCFVFEKDPSSIGPGAFNWRRVYNLGNHSLFLGLNYPIIQPIIDHITGDDYRVMQLPVARGDYLYTSYHGFHESPYLEIRHHSLLPDNLHCVKGIKIPCDEWLLQIWHAVMWFMPTTNMDNLIRTNI